MHWLRDRRICRRRPAGLFARAVHALRARALRAGLPGGCFRTRQRGAERPGLQPLRRHALLPIELPLQGAALQFLRICRRPGIRKFRRRHRQSRIQSRRHRARPRRHGEMHLLRPAHQPRAAYRRKGRPHHPRRRGGHRMPGGLPDTRDHVRQSGGSASRDPRAARRSRKATRCSANSARDRARPIWRGCKTPTRTFGKSQS